MQISTITNMSLYIASPLLNLRVGIKKGLLGATQQTFTNPLDLTSSYSQRDYNTKLRKRRY